ncbi:polysaccharide deacetylase family protein [Clostridium fallax]|uniref:Peptidoglycan/xylan/chitin deacetylase, PgdA/CDA1 family n=1 Tax=Clostridium fallax TaxID=1533 RepID=A0A1M4VVH1_9CLOT|nr:polysaccharide deacetylase family protein [Clostridium fallax]SHE72937.1 Peptidoglycan/xylan/chitin deacetylase, PgdA/CDA1 family [Clostridium fallax]SQB07714.1 polysaccharide deacetylase [Clostridium fallax]
MKKFIYLLILFILSSLFIGSSLPVNEEKTLDEKFVYLTFDDGPNTPVTTEVLDVLKEKNVKATFFLIGNLVNKEKDLVQRMAKEDHSLGLHSYTHDKNKLYKNSESFINEMLDTQKAIYEVTGITSNILRFPFGSNNKSFRLTKTMVDSLHKYNFKIYDWNIDSGDGLNPYLEPYKIAKNCSNAKNGSIILMHCSSVNKNTAKALPIIIDNLKKQGFTFKKIDESTKEVYRVKK